MRKQKLYELEKKNTFDCSPVNNASFFFYSLLVILIYYFSFNKLHLQMEELEQKHLHLLQVVESEKTAKWQYTQHCEELTEDIKKLRTEVSP